MAGDALKALDLGLPRGRPKPALRRVEPLGHIAGWFYYRALGGQIMAIRAGHHTPRGISLLSAGLTIP